MWTDVGTYVSIAVWIGVWTGVATGVTIDMLDHRRPGGVDDVLSDLFVDDGADLLNDALVEYFRPDVLDGMWVYVWTEAQACLETDSVVDALTETWLHTSYRQQ